MKTKTIEAFQNYIEANYRTIRSLAADGTTLDITCLSDARDRLWDALENEITEEKP